MKRMASAICCLLVQRVVDEGVQFKDTDSEGVDAEASNWFSLDGGAQKQEIDEASGEFHFLGLYFLRFSDLNTEFSKKIAGQIILSI